MVVPRFWAKRAIRLKCLSRVVSSGCSHFGTPKGCQTDHPNSSIFCLTFLGHFRAVLGGDCAGLKPWSLECDVGPRGETLCLSPERSLATKMDRGGSHSKDSVHVGFGYAVENPSKEGG